MTKAQQETMRDAKDRYDLNCNSTILRSISSVFNKNKEKKTIQIYLTLVEQQRLTYANEFHPLKHTNTHTHTHAHKYAHIRIPHEQS